MVPAAIRTRQRQSIKVMRHSPWADSSNCGNSAWFGILNPQYPAEDELKLNPLKRFANSFRDASAPEAIKADWLTISELPPETETPQNLLVAIPRRQSHAHFEPGKRDAPARKSYLAFYMPPNA